MKTCRDEILETIRTLGRRSQTDRFTIQQVINEMNAKGTTYSENTIRTHIASRMCRDAPDNHAVVYDDLERVGRGEYRLRRRGA
jgi:DNA-binding transcriptional regulator YhcF (GntR family)